MSHEVPLLKGSLKTGNDSHKGTLSSFLSRKIRCSTLLMATEGGSGTVSGWTGESKAKPLLGIPWEGTVETGQTDMTGECRQFQ